jgi:hypothetical protein
MLHIYISLFLGYALLMWFRTNVFVEYMNLFSLSRFFKIDEYNKLHAEGFSELYIDFLSQYYRVFFIVRLLICPICVSFWLGLFVSFFHTDIKFLICAPLILFFYSVFNRML